MSIKLKYVFGFLTLKKLIYTINPKHISTTKRENFHLFYFTALKSLKKPQFLKHLFHLDISPWEKLDTKIPNLFPEISTSQNLIIHNIFTVGPAFPNHQICKPPRPRQELLSNLGALRVSWISYKSTDSTHFYWSETLSGAAICQIIIQREINLAHSWKKGSTE